MHVAPTARAAQLSVRAQPALRLKPVARPDVKSANSKYLMPFSADPSAVQTLKNVCVFCGASVGSDPLFMAAAKRMGEVLVEQKLHLVYGGGTVGLMGEIARTVVAGLGDDAVIGVIPEELAPRELSGQMVGKVHIVDNMHTRKALMAQHADAFIALPGGFGTLEELLEVITWQQLGFHRKPIGLLNIGGFYDPLLAFFSHAVQHGFIKAHHSDALLVSDDPGALLDKMRAFTAPLSLIQQLSAGSTAAIGVDISKSSSNAEPLSK